MSKHSLCIKYLFVPLLTLVCVAMLSCHNKDEEEAKIEKINVSEIGKEIRVPLKMWEVLLTKSTAEGGKKDEKKAEGEGAVASADESFVFADAAVSFKEKNPDILSKPEIEINFPRGGGEINLADYVTSNQGSFFVKIDTSVFEGASEKKVLFISHSRKRKIDEQIFGSGCKYFYDISDEFFKAMGKDGIKVNTTRQRHVSVLSGTFILMSKKNKQNYITQVTFTDSKYQNLACNYDKE